MFKMDVEIEYTDDYPLLYNDPEMTDLVVEAVKSANINEITDIIDCGPQPPLEDFSYYAKERPSCFFYVGAKKEDAPYPHHHPKFDIREDAMKISAKAMAAVVAKYLGGKNNLDLSIIEFCKIICIIFLSIHSNRKKI